MILACPNCETRYLVDDAALRNADGRRVRCSSCGHLWRYSLSAAAIRSAVAGTTEVAAAVAIAAAPAPVAEPPRAAVRTELQPRPAGPTAQPRPSVAVGLAAAARERGRRVAGLSLVSLAAGLVLVAILAPDMVLAIYPPAAPVYAALHLVEPADAGLEIAMKPPTRASDSFVVDGDVSNTGGTPRQVPRLRVALRDGNGNVLDSKLIDPPVERLQPGATTHFNTVFEHPSITATGADATFATD